MIINPIVIVGGIVKALSGVVQYLVIEPSHQKAKEDKLAQIHDIADQIDNQELRQQLKAVELDIASRTWEYFKMYFRGLWHQRIKKGHWLTAGLTAIAFLLIAVMVWHYLLADNLDFILQMMAYSVLGIALWYGVKHAVKHVPGFQEYIESKKARFTHIKTVLAAFSSEKVRAVIDEQERYETQMSSHQPKLLAAAVNSDNLAEEKSG